MVLIPSQPLHIPLPLQGWHYDFIQTNVRVHRESPFQNSLIFSFTISNFKEHCSGKTYHANCRWITIGMKNGVYILKATRFWKWSLNKRPDGITSSVATLHRRNTPLAKLPSVTAFCSTCSSHHLFAHCPLPLGFCSAGGPHQSHQPIVLDSLWSCLW